MASKYLVTYDLVGTDENSDDYRELISRIKRYPECIKIQKSVWAIESAFDASEIRDELGSHMDANDRLYVVPISSGAAWRNLICGGSAYVEFMDA
jgi:hypothetical protein